MLYADKKMYSNSSAPNLDKEYSPSLNTKRFQEFPKPNEQLIENFIKVTKAETERVRAKYKVRENVRYGGEDDNQLLDIYYKHDENDSPIFVYIHGGYWQDLDKSSAGSFVEPLVERNYRVVVVDYNLCPSVTLDQLMEQTGNFYKWLFQYADRTKASKVSLCGHSAGAQLASLLLKNLPKTSFAQWISSFFLISGLYDLRELWQLECANPNNILSLNELKAAELSPLCWTIDAHLVNFCRSLKVKVHVLVAENDSSTFIGQSRQYAERLEAVGIEVIFKIFSNYDHFDIIEDAACQGSDINRYIIEHL